ncbi:N-acetylmuramoyl-L-alanine amidase, partial [Bacillus cereus]
KVGNWLNLGGNQWIYNDSSYIRYKEEWSSVEGKRVVSKVNDLRFYSKPSWLDRDVAGTVDEGLGFTIDEKIIVDGSPQFKVHNSKGTTFYVTEHSKFVYIK